MKTQVQTPPAHAVSSTIIRLVFLGTVILGCVYAIVTLCASALTLLQ